MKHCLVQFQLILLILSCQAQIRIDKNIEFSQKHFANYTFTNLINYPKTTAKVNEFRGKVLILDFWNSGCAGCIMSWPKLLELQKKYKNNVQIILVNPWESKTVVTKSFKRRSEIAGVKMTLPTSCNDKELLKIFKIDGIPMVVWINEKGKLMSISSGDELTNENIGKIVTEKLWKLKSYVSNDDLRKFTADIREPLFVNNNGGFIDTVFWQSILTKSKDSLWSGVYLRSDSYGCFAHCAKCTVTDLYRLAYSNRFDENGKLERLTVSTIREELNNDSLVVGAAIDSGVEKVRYNYHLTCPNSSIEKLQTWLQEDLKRYFGYKVMWENRKVICLVLKAMDTTLIMYKSGPTLPLIDISMLHFNNVSVAYLIYKLAEVTLTSTPYPILDETSFKGLLGNIELNTDMTNLRLINEAFKKYKMSLTLAERNFDVLVLRR